MLELFGFIDLANAEWLVILERMIIFYKIIPISLKNILNW